MTACWGHVANFMSPGHRGDDREPPETANAKILFVILQCNIAYDINASFILLFSLPPLSFLFHGGPHVADENITHVADEIILPRPLRVAHRGTNRKRVHRICLAHLMLVTESSMRMQDAGPEART